jgi:hypothetical protein
MPGALIYMATSWRNNQCRQQVVAVEIFSKQNSLNAFLHPTSSDFQDSLRLIIFLVCKNRDSHGDGFVFRV